MSSYSNVVYGPEKIIAAYGAHTRDRFEHVLSTNSLTNRQIHASCEDRAEGSSHAAYASFDDLNYDHYHSNAIVGIKDDTTWSSFVKQHNNGKNSFSFDFIEIKLSI